MPTLNPTDIAIHTPYYHEGTEAVRFWVPVNGVLVGASVRRQVLHDHFHRERHDDEPLPTFLGRAEAMAAAVRRRVAGGSIEPVMLREFDLAAIPPG
jgi:hypothetical protein